MNRSGALAAVLAVAGTASCGPLPPQAPSAYARKINHSTSGISTLCGEAYRVTGFPGNHQHDLQQLDATATSNARVLAQVFRRNSAWVYQGQTVKQIVGAGEQMLALCGLHRAERELRSATAGS